MTTTAQTWPMTSGALQPTAPGDDASRRLARAYRVIRERAAELRRQAVETKQAERNQEAR